MHAPPLIRRVNEKNSEEEKVEFNRLRCIREVLQQSGVRYV